MQFDRKNTKVLRLFNFTLSESQFNPNESLSGSVFVFLVGKQTYFCSSTLTDKRVTACPGGVLGCGFENGGHCWVSVAGRDMLSIAERWMRVVEG